MEADAPLPQPDQLLLFRVDDESVGQVELFPAVWAAAEALSASDVRTRRAGLKRIEELGAYRYSPLVVYLIASRITDSDAEVRDGSVRLLGKLLRPDETGKLPPFEVRQRITYFLAQMRTRTIYSLLQAVESNPTLEIAVADMLNVCPHAGSHLAEILTARKTPLSLRKWAARMIGQVGFLEAVSVLERLEIKLAARVNGQAAMPFATSNVTDEVDLLPDIKAALHILRAP